MLYAIGDIHGRSDLLDAALARIEAHAGEASAHIVCLGDYVDRGPDSRGVIDRLMAGPRRAGDRLTCLKGNHEALLLAYLAGEPVSGWYRLEAAETVASYGGDAPAGHKAWMAGLPHSFQTDHHIFVHAGLRPGVAIADQDPEEMLWIRDLFLKGDHDFGKHVVHGHTPRWIRHREEAEVERLANRTNLDTGACWTGVLSVGVFDADRPGGPVELFAVLG